PRSACGSLISLYGTKPNQRLLLCCKNLSDEADIGGDSDSKLLRVNHLRSGHKGDAYILCCRAPPLMNEKVPTGTARRFKACQAGYVNQESLNSCGSRNSNGMGVRTCGAV